MAWRGLPRLLFGALVARSGSALLAALAACADEATTAPAATAPRLTAVASAAAPAAANGRIAFASSRDGVRTEIYTVNPDGSGLARLTTNDSTEADPAWSPDGTRIAFTSHRSGRDVYVMNADGSGQTPLSPVGASSYDGWPTWAPDGARLAYASADYGSDAPNLDIYAINADGSGRTRLTTDPADDGEPAWSPDGSRIAFVSFRDGNADLYLMNADGSDVRRLTTDADYDLEPAWSPDGSRIAFVRGFDAIYVMNADGSGETRVTPVDATADYTPSWSPDGTRLLFWSYRDGGVGAYTVRPDGSDVVRLPISGNVFELAWQPIPIVPLAQAITFTSTPPAPTLVGSTYAVAAAGGGSGQPVVFGTLTPSTCTVAGATVRLVAVGPCTVAADQAGGAGHAPAPRATQHLAVVYPFAGFFGPVRNAPAVNEANAGRAVPLAFSLGGDRGLGVLAAGSPSSQPVPCAGGATGGAPVPAAAAGNSGLTYDAASGQYTYVWKTDRAWAGTCRVLTLTLADGTAHAALFRFGR